MRYAILNVQGLVLAVVEAAKIAAEMTKLASGGEVGLWVKPL